MTGFDLFAPGGYALVALLALRIGGLLLVAPVFSARSVPMQVRAALLVLLTVLLIPVAAGRADAAPAVTPATMAAETLVGFAVGLGAAVFIGASELAGDYLAMQTGLSNSSLLDPMNQSPVPTLGQFAQLFTVTLFLSLDGHVLMLDALTASAEAVPLGGAVAFEHGVGALVALGGELFSIGLRFAAPVVVAVMISNLALGILSKAAPQFNVLMVAFPVQIGVGLVTLGLALPVVATFVATWPALYEGVVAGLLEALRP